MLSVGAKIICIDEKFVKIYFKVIFNGLMKHFSLIKILQKAIVKIVIEHIS